MPKTGDVSLSQLYATYNGDDPVVSFSVAVNNLTDADLDHAAAAVTFTAVGQSGQAQSKMAASNYCERIPANDGIVFGLPLQLDAGEWEVSALVFDGATNQLVAEHEGIWVTMRGAVDTAAGFDASVQHQLEVQIQRLEHLQDSVYRVHYTLANLGTATLPPGMLVRAMLVEEQQKVLAWQDYHFTTPCPPGERRPKYLTLEGSTGFRDAVVYVTVDPEGSSVTGDQATVTVTADGLVHLRR